MHIIKLIRRIGGGGNSAKAEMEYLLSKGLRVGADFHNFSPYAIDANWPWLISIGDNVTIASGVKLLAHDASTSHAGAHTKIGRVTIGNNVFVGANSVVLCNTKIGSNVVIGAGSVVTHDIPDNCVYAGNPARLICTFQEYQNKHLRNLDTHPYFKDHKWNEWPEVSEEERNQMAELLNDTFGYV